MRAASVQVVSNIKREPALFNAAAHPDTLSIAVLVHLVVAACVKGLTFVTRSKFENETLA